MLSLHKFLQRPVYELIRFPALNELVYEERITRAEADSYGRSGERTKQETGRSPSSSEDCPARRLWRKLVGPLSLGHFATILLDKFRILRTFLEPLFELPPSIDE